MSAAEIQIDTSEFEEAMRQFQSTSKKGFEENIRKEGRLLSQAIMQLTPPNKEKENKAGGFVPSWNKSGGNTTIANDLAKIFRSSKKGITNPAMLHKRFRTRRGRVMNKTLYSETNDKRIKVDKLGEYKKQMQARVGYLASGWAAAAKALNFNVPAWIAKHSAPGSGGAKLSGNKLTIELTNDAVYGQIKSLLERRVKNALTFRQKTMMKQVNNYMSKAAAKAGLTYKE
jgi:hypothetical protein